MNRKEISKLLMKTGMSPSLRGFDYIIDAVEIILSDRDSLYSLTKSLYPAIAEKHNCSASTVDRCIIHAISKSFEYASHSVVEEIFGNAYNLSKGRPTNGEYIAALVEKIRYQDSDIEEKADGLICKRCEYYNNSNCICNFKGDKTWHYIDGKRRSCDRFIERRKNNE